MVPVTNWLSSIQNIYFPALLKVKLVAELRGIFLVKRVSMVTL